MRNSDCRRRCDIAQRTAAVLAAVLAISVTFTAAAERDPHRPTCTTRRCLQIKSYLKAHYCGELPYGNGPDDGCQIVDPRGEQPNVQAIAKWSCDFDTKTNEQVCRQQGQVSASIRRIVERQMEPLGLAPAHNSGLGFTVLKSTSAGWSVVEGNYYRLEGENATFCQVVLTVSDGGYVQVLRKHRCRKSNADVGEGTSWSALGIDDVDGDGAPDIVLEGDEYENHWLEVVSLRGGSAQTIFSGLGYYL